MPSERTTAMAARARSHWSWGYEDKLPSDEARHALAQRLGALFGHEPRLRALPSFDGAALSPPRFAPPVELRRIGTTDARERALHTYGRGYPDLVRGFRGDFEPAPDWVFYPTDEAHLVLLFRFCEHESIAIVPYGGGTSVVGGVTHPRSARYRGTASVDLSRMDRVLEVDATSRAARIQAGASGPRIAEQLKPHGLVLRHYPQSYELSTLGGWIATRAAGHYATLHTRIDDFVEAVRMVSPAGVVATRRLPASGAGPKADTLVLGSEGALGIITEAWIRVSPEPRWRISKSVYFACFEDGVEAARALAQSGLYPANCRLLDPAEALLHEVATDGSSVLLLAFESADHPVASAMDRALEIARAHRGDVGHGHDGGDREIDEDAARWRRAFFDAPYLQSALVSLGVVCDTFETACTWDRFPALHEAIRAAATKAMNTACGAGIVTCRFTHLYADGPAPYYTFVAPGREGEELEQWSMIKEAASDAIVANGGTITHHHAVGRLHRPWWDEESSGLHREMLEAAKARVDPDGILNPGCLLRSRV